MPSPVSCPVSLIVILFLSLCLCPASTEIWGNEVSDVQYGSLGSNVTLACGTSPSSRKVVEWRLNNKSLVLPWYHVTSEGGLVLQQVDQSQEGNYSCHSDHGLLLHVVRLRLGYPPGLLSVSCRLSNHSLVVCSWTESVKTHLPAQYHANYRGQSQVNPCVVDSSLQCCVIEQPTMWQPSHWLSITQTNPLGSMTTRINVRFNKLLKPDPPERVWVSGVEGHPRMLQVGWLYPSSWHDDKVTFSLIFQLQYRPLGSKLWSILDSRSSPLVVTDALAGHVHELQVRAHDGVEDGSQWSDWSPLLLASPWIAPTPEPEDLEEFPTDEPEKTTSTENSKSYNPDPDPEQDGGVGLVILMAFFAAFILVTVATLFTLMWVRQRRRDHGTKQELSSIVKLKSMPV